MDLSIRVAFSAIDKLTRPVNAASKTVGRLSDSLKNTIFSQGFGKRRCVVRQVAHEGQRNRAEPENTQRALDGLNQKQREGGQLTGGAGGAPLSRFAQ